MKIRHVELPSGTTEGISFLIDDRWTLEQAMAVFELIDDLRAQIWRHYGPQLQQRYLEDRVVDGSDHDHDGGDVEF